MKFFQITILLVLAQLTASSQSFSVQDSFDDNRYNWWTGELDGGSQSIREGKLLLNTPDNGWMLAISPFVDFEKDFKAEMSIKQTAGIEDHGVGFMWGYSKNDSDQNTFTIAATGYFMVNCTSLETNKKKDIGEWVKTSYVKPVGQVNVLKVEQVGKVLNFYINDQKVFTAPAFRWRSTDIGIATYGKMNLEIDNFKFIQNNKINLPPDLTKGLKKENLGSAINTSAEDLSPIITADGRQLYFGRENYQGNLGGIDDGEDFYTSTFDGTKWLPAKNMGSPICTTGVDNIVSVSADNNQVFFADGEKFLVRTRNQAGGWSEAKEIGLSFVNEATHFEAMISSDGKAIFMALKNNTNLYYDKGMDVRDLYVSTQDKSGNWSKPVNLGPTINTRMNEISPFLGADGRTLYFSSTGRPGYGDADIYMAKRVGESWTQWTEPVNLGPEINTASFDAYYTIPASGEYAYMSSNQNGMGKTDIIRIKLAKELKPEPVVLVKGRTLDAKTKQPISANVLIDNLTSNKEVSEAISDPKTGDFQMVLPSNSNNGFHAAANGYLSVNENMELQKVEAYTEIQKDLYLLPIEVGQTIQLNNVFFEQSKSILKSESYPELDRLVAIMKESPTLEIELGGYTDNVGNPSSLVALSQQRVEIVKKYMIEQGISSKRIAGKGYGPANPLVKNDTEPHRRMNRRVEFKVIKK